MPKALHLRLFLDFFVRGAFLRLRTTPHQSFKMRQLTEQETKTLFEKLANYTGRSLNNLITTSDDPNDRYVFRLHGNRVYYMKLSLANLSTAIPRANLLSLGTCIGKFTKSGQFRLHITGKISNH